MSSSDRKLINAKFFVALLEKTSTEEKKKDLSKYLNAGASINETFVIDSDNTPLHIAVQNEELEVVKFLLELGANVNKINISNETALDVAKKLVTNNKSAIVKILEDALLKEGVFADDDPKLVYQKRVGTSGIEGQLYETKLLSLVLIRALVHKKISQFSLGTSLSGIDALDDISIRYKAEGKEHIIFLQAKHRKDINKGRVTYQELWKSSGDFSLSKYFHSYLKIKEKFINVNDDVIFEGTYEDVKCFFIIYTPATYDLHEDNLKRTTINPIVNELIRSGKRCELFQYKYTEKDIDSLKQIILVQDMEYLGRSLFELKDKYTNMMTNDLIRKFHVVLRQQVFNVSDVKPNGYRQGTFRDEFFHSNDILLMTIKETIFREAVSKTTPSKLILKARIKTLKNKLTSDNLSKVLQIVNLHINIKQNTLEILDKRFKEFNNNLSTLKVSPSLFNNALELATYEKLRLFQIKLPNTFGNIDISAKNEKTLNYLAKQITTIISKANGTMIKIDKNCIGRGKLIEPAIVEKGGLGSAIGNLLILDVNHEIKSMLKFNLDSKSLRVNSRNVLMRIQNIPDLQAYRLQINLDNCPKLTFDEECNEITTKDFLDNMWFFTSQAKEDETEKYSKGVLYEYHNAKTSKNKKMLSVRCEGIFLKIHDAVQKWWLKIGKSYYLTNESQYYNKILNDFEDVQILNIINYISVIKIDKYNIEFNDDTINSLNLDGKLIIIETDVDILTANKLRQYFRTKNAELDNCTFLDLDYVLSISETDYDSFKYDIRNTSLETLVVIFGNKGEDFGAKLNTIHWLVSETIIKKYIVVVDKDTASIIKANDIKNTFERVVINNSLIDLTPDSQCVVLERNLLFQGTDIKWNIIINEQSKKFIKGDILIRILNKEKIELGKTLTNQKYEEMKDYYVTRSLRSPKTTIPVNKVDLNSHVSLVLSPYSLDVGDNNKIIAIKTLLDLNNVIVLLAAPGMGKSTFLTHLSIATKKESPELWIERINLIDYDFYFKYLKNNEKEINRMEALKFICKIVLSKKIQLRRDIKKSFDEIKFDIEIINGELRLKSFKYENVMALLTLELFIGCYNKRQTLFLFDGFDELCPHHQVITLLLKCLVSLPVNNSSENKCAKQKMWITSRSYNNIRRTLEVEFGSPYILEPFTDIEEELFMENYMKVNLKLGDLNNEQFENIDGLFEYVKSFASHIQCDRQSMKVIETKPYKLTNLLLHSLYFGAVKYFQSEIKHTPLYEEKRVYASKWNQLKLHRTTLVDNFSRIFKTANEVYTYNRNMQNFIQTPLHMFVAIEHLKSIIKDTKTDSNDIIRKWNFDLTTFDFYERFFEEKLRKILFEEKYQVDLNITKLEGIYEKERKEFIDDYKKIAFYTIFKDDYNEILSQEVVVKIKDSIKRMESGDEETGLIDYVINGVPKFIHFCFAEYLTVEYISDLIKTTPQPLEQRKLWKFIIHKLLFKKIRGVLCVFDLKLCNDSDLRNAILNLSVDVKEFVLDELLEQKVNPLNMHDLTVLDDVTSNSLGYIARILLNVVTDVVNKLNYSKFDLLIKRASWFFLLCEFLDVTELSDIVFDCARNNGLTSSLASFKAKANEAKNIASSMNNLQKQEVEKINRSNLQKKDTVVSYVYYK